MLRLCALNITKSRDSKEDQHKKKSDSLHACYQITTTVPHMTLTKGIISQGRKTIIKNYLKKKNKLVFLYNTCKCPTRRKSNDQEEQEVPKDGLPRVNRRKQMILNDLLKSISLISRTTASYMKEIQLFKICCSNSIKKIVKRTRSSDKYILNNHLFGKWKQFLSQKLHALLCPVRSQVRIRTCCSSQQSIMTIQHVKSLYASSKNPKH